MTVATYLFQLLSWKILKAVCSFNHSSSSHPSLKVVHLLLSQKNYNNRFFDVYCTVFIRFTTCCHSLSLLATCCHSLSLIVICCHSLSFVVPLIVFRCHSLIFSVTRFTTRCHLFLLVVTRCTTRLSFYKRSLQSMKFATTCFFKIAVHKFQKCKRENL